MEAERAGAESTGFSYEVLDAEARRISDLVFLLHEKFQHIQSDDLPAAIFDLSEAYKANGRTAEAEFLCLHAINIWERRLKLDYPYSFTSLVEYARLLRERDAQVRTSRPLVDLPGTPEAAAGQGQPDQTAAV